MFTPDVINFFIRIYGINKETGEREAIVTENGVYSYSRWENLSIKHRYLQVVESIAVVSIFTTLKYFASQPGMFTEKIIKYARTLDCKRYDRFCFEYVTIQKIDGQFQYIPTAFFEVDPERETVNQTVLQESFRPGELASGSPIRESESVGSYVRKSD